ncbi:hypothetical protein FB451DRAFT_1292735 [Mycena latifolia]|nr:hypothetical protein FB451DRAFT_1292735 [Mycena latifolia]
MVAVLWRLPALEQLDIDTCDLYAGPLIQKLGMRRSQMNDTQTLAFLSKFPSARVIAQLEGIGTLTSLILAANLTSWAHSPERDMCYAFLNTPYGFFPDLTELRIAIMHIPMRDDVNSAATSFFKTLPDALALPPTLQHLGFSLNFTHEFEIVPSDAPPNFPTLRNALLARCPALASLWLDGEDFLFSWSKDVDGTVVEATAYNYKDAEVMRNQQKATFWQHSRRPRTHST